MILTYAKIVAVAAMVFVAPAKAREVDLSRFAPSAIAASGGDGPVEVALRAHLQGISQPVYIIDKIGKGASASQNPLSCPGNGYLQTWWLPAEVEKRRATYFEAMSQIACENGLPASLLDAVVAQESGYKAWAISRAGAMGMMQVMPGTARHLELWNPWDALANMRAGARYLRQQLDRFERVDLALAAYNAGPERRSLTLGYIPAIPETRNYVRTITTNWLRLTQLNRPDSSALARVAAASTAIRASGYREVSLITYDGMNSANPI
ncbi:lytic transglycosylase domain-containing protein [Sphingobium yanoikuyae]|uniref:lytic transglycosylase domain-containing protein n=1 Tax=Sphingobium yanoikuyae TaxID=13690 RepID=UPI001F3DC17F|nr:lytic transglycosylase domain-containing protein [Sphingobium yanoikuyae]